MWFFFFHLDFTLSLDPYPVSWLCSTWSSTSNKFYKEPRTKYKCANQFYKKLRCALDIKNAIHCYKEHQFFSSQDTLSSWYMGTFPLVQFDFKIWITISSCLQLLASDKIYSYVFFKTDRKVQTVPVTYPYLLLRTVNWAGWSEGLSEVGIRDKRYQ